MIIAASLGGGVPVLLNPLPGPCGRVFLLRKGKAVKT